MYIQTCIIKTSLLGLKVSITLYVIVASVMFERVEKMLSLHGGILVRMDMDVDIQL